MSLGLEILLSLLLVTGGIFGLVGSYGLLKLKQPMQRLHAPTKAVTVGVATALMAASFDLYMITGHIAWQNFLVVPFLFVTAPLSALYLAKAHLHLTVPRGELPPTGTAAVWATLDDPQRGA